MSTAERIHMCLAEAGFIDGRDYKAMYGIESDGYVISYTSEQYTPALQAAIDKARELVGLPSLLHAEPYIEGMWTCDPTDRKAV